MKVLMITAPIIEPIDLNEIKIHLRIELDQIEEDEMLEQLIKAAREHVEDITRRQLLTATWDYYLDEFPDEHDFIKLPFGNLQSVTSVKYEDSDGTETTMAESTDYLVETNGEQCGRIILPYEGSWPSATLYPSNPIKIRFISGWTTAALIPFKIKAAIKMLCANLYEGRGEPVLGQTLVENKTVERLLASTRLWDEF